MAIPTAQGNESDNPLLQRWNTPYGLPPFGAVRPEHFEPAFDAAIAGHRAEIDAIGADPEAPTFANTIAAFDRAGRMLVRLCHLFFNLTSSETSPALQAVETRMAPLLAAHESWIYMHRGLFARIEHLHERRADLGLNAEQQRVLERFHTDFERAGARLGPAQQQRYAAVMQRLAELTPRRDVLYGEVDELLGQADRPGAQPDAPVVEHLHRAVLVWRPRSHARPLSAPLIVPAANRRAGRAAAPARGRGRCPSPMDRRRL